MSDTAPALNPAAQAAPKEPLDYHSDTPSFLGPASADPHGTHGSVPVPRGHWIGRLMAFVGPAYLISVGYMDPGNWATDLRGGALFGYRLIWVLAMSNLMAILLQTLAARLGLVTGRDLAQACRESYGPWARWSLFVLCEIAIAACDLAEVLGTAIGIHLLFPHVPLIVAVLITSLDVLALLAMQRWGMRKMEAFIVVLIVVIGACFIIEIFLSRPSWPGIVRGIVPGPLSSVGGEDSMLYTAIGILGATVMPHNLYLHSSLVQSRAVRRTPAGIAQAAWYNFLDSAIALNGAFLVNCAILIVAAATFWARGSAIANQVVGIEDAHRLLQHLLGTRVAPIVFALALICAGQSSTITGTLAGQITMEGFLEFRMRPWIRRLVTRLLAIVPAVLVIWLSKGRSTDDLLILSQVVLSLQLPFAVVPLVKFTGSRRRMGRFANPRWVALLAWVVTIVIIALNGKLVYDQIHDWRHDAGPHGWIVSLTAVPPALLLGGLLAWMIFRRDGEARPVRAASAKHVAAAALERPRQFRRIGVALDASDSDSAMLAEAVALARSHAADLLLLMHVVEGPGGQWHGTQTDDAESRHDEQYLFDLADALRDPLRGDGVGDVQAALGFGNVARELVRIARERHLDMIVAGGHGHAGLSDLIRGETLSKLRHGVAVPVLAVKGPGHG